MPGAHDLSHGTTAPWQERLRETEGQLDAQHEAGGAGMAGWKSPEAEPTIVSNRVWWGWEFANKTQENPRDSVESMSWFQKLQKLSCWELVLE